MLPKQADHFMKSMVSKMLITQWISLFNETEDSAAGQQSDN